LLLAGFLAGLLLNLTPCVYPLIPITLSFFSQQARESTGGKFALGVSYMLGIALSFGVFGAVSVLVGKGFGTLFQSPWFNLGVFALLHFPCSACTKSDCLASCRNSCAGVPVRPVRS
ncbi:MAG: hypothetical protein C4340_02795, partial [Armatimonadota bacterium]